MIIELDNYQTQEEEKTENVKTWIDTFYISRTLTPMYNKSHFYILFCSLIFGWTNVLNLFLLSAMAHWSALWVQVYQNE